MSEYIYTYHCGECHGELQSVTDEWLDGKAIRGHWECSECGATGGIWMDGGTVDLDAIRESDLRPDNEFVIFDQLP